LILTTAAAAAAAGAAAAGGGNKGKGGQAGLEKASGGGVIPNLRLEVPLGVSQTSQTLPEEWFT